MRHQPFSHADFLVRQAAAGLSMCTIFSSPGLTVECCKFDWLHAADQGVTADFLGNLFKHLLEYKYIGLKEQSKCTKLYLDIARWYQDHTVQAKLPTLTPTMVQLTAARPPKLRAKAAEARALVGFAFDICLHKLDDADPLEQTIKQAARRLYRAYDCLSAAQWDEAAFQANV